MNCRRSYRHRHGLNVIAGVSRVAGVCLISLEVAAVDRNFEAILKLLAVPGITARQLDLEDEAWPLVGERFVGIVVTNYLWRPRLLDVLAMLAPGGVLIYETFMLGNEAYGKPTNPEFLLRPGELRQVV